MLYNVEQYDSRAFVYCILLGV